ncbi:hypothetical protein ACJ4V0_14380 [Phreatobacter sp. HK31-P]
MDNAGKAPRPLTDAMRAIRIDEAERTGVVVALREADLARLEMLHDRLKPVLAEVPQGLDLFDVGITPGATPRLWIDMIAFVEVGRDRRTYRFLQDTRNGRRVMIESDDAGAVADRVTAYVARRLIERERLLALPPAATEPATALPRADLPPVFTVAGVPPAAEVPSQPQSVATSAPAPLPAMAASPPRGGVRFSGIGAFVLFLLGIGVGIGGVIAFAHLATRF